VLGAGGLWLLLARARARAWANCHLRWHVEASFQIAKKSHELLLVSQALLWPFLLGFGLDGRLLLARRGRVYV